MSLWISSMAREHYRLDFGSRMKQCIELCKLLGFINGELDMPTGWSTGRTEAKKCRYHVLGISRYHVEEGSLFKLKVLNCV